MAGASSIFDSVDNASTLVGVAVGAVVATLGSFAASWWERKIFRREREADAALLFGEVLRTLALQITLLKGAHARGDPFGAITIRLARSVRREVEIYDRNRERLFQVRDAELRPRAGAAIARLTFALDRVLDSTEALAANPSEEDRAQLMTGREQAFEFLVEVADELPALVDRFAKLANTRLADFDLSLIGFAPPSRVRADGD
jgi:hypothetical protein